MIQINSRPIRCIYDGVYVNTDDTSDQGDVQGVQGGVQGAQEDLQQDEVTNNEGGQKGSQKEDKTVDIILKLIKQNPNITRKELSESVGIAPIAIQKHINKLKDNGTIVRHGGDRGDHWEVLKQQ